MRGLRSKAALPGLLLAAAALGLALWLVGQPDRESGSLGVQPAPDARATGSDAEPDLTGPEPAAELADMLAGAATGPDPHRARQGLEASSRLVSGLVVLPEGEELDPRTKVVLRASAEGRLIEERASIDGAGAFSFRASAAVRYARLDLESEHLYLEAPPRIDLRERSEGLRLEARLGGGLIVRVFDPDGRVPPEAIGATVRFTGRAHRGATVDSRGQARFDALAPGGLGSVLCEVPGFLPPTKAEPVVVEAGRTREHELLLVRGASLAGRVLDSAGLALAGARVGVYGSSWTWGGPERSTATDAAGLFELGEVRPGDVILRAEHPDHAAAESRIDGLQEGEHRAGFELGLGAARSIAGHAVWPDLRAAEGVWVHVEGAFDPGDMSVVRKNMRIRSSSHSVPSPRAEEREPGARTDADGRFEVKGLGKAPYTVSVSHLPSGEQRQRLVDAGHLPGSEGPAPWFAARIEGVAADARDLLVVLEPTASLEGRVVDERGEVFGGARVLARRVTTTGMEWAQRQTSSPTTGDFRFDEILPGSYEVLASGGAGLGEAQWIDVPLRDSNLVLVAPRGGRITGHVVADGAPVADASVRLDRDRAFSSNSFSDGARKEVSTDEQGRFEIHPVAPGTHTLEARHQTLGRSAGQRLTLASGDEVQGLVLELDAPGWIEGRIAREVGRRAGRTIEVMSHDPLHVEKATSDASGLFTVPGLRPGLYELCLLTEGTTWRFDAAVTAEVHSGRATQVVLGGGPRAVRVLGLVRAGGVPLADMAVRAWVSTGSDELEVGATTAGSGRFELDLPAGGHAYFQFGAHGSSHDEGRFLPDGEPASLVFELPLGVVAGQVLAHDGRPAAHALVQLHGLVVPDRVQAADSQGRFVFEHVAPGSYLVAGGGSRILPAQPTGAGPAEAIGAYGYRSSEPLDLAGGERLEGLRLVLPAPAGLRGGLHLPAGHHSDDLWLTATPLDSPSGSPVARAEVRGDRYQIRGLGPGMYRIDGIAYGDPGAMLERHVTLSEGQDLVLDLSFE